MNIKLFYALSEPIGRMRHLESLYAKIMESNASIPQDIVLNLIEILQKDQNAVVRHEAAFMLGQFSPRLGINRVSAVESLRLAATTDVSIVVQHEAIEALGWFDIPEVVAFLKTLLIHTNVDIRDTASVSFGRLANIRANVE